MLQFFLSVRISSNLMLFWLLFTTRWLLLNARFNLSKYSLPDDFMLGVASSAYQIEGGWNEGGRGESFWDTYIHKRNNFIKDNSSGDISSDFYHKYKDDIPKIKALGVSHFRMSISWTHILPNGTDNYINKEGIKYYRDIFKRLIKSNVTPVITLYHWDLPTILMEFGGWTNAKVIDYFEDYARIAFKHFGDLIKIWVTVNEPRQQCYFGYGSDLYFPALKSSGIGDYLCIHNMLLAHARVYRLYQNKFKKQQNGIIGITYDVLWSEPKDPNKQEDIEAAEIYMEFNLGIFAHPIFSRAGDYPSLVRQKIDTMSTFQNYSRSRLPYFSSDELTMLQGSANFIGLNHYTSCVAFPTSSVKSVGSDSGIQTEQPQKWPKPGVEWLAVYPEGLRKLINWFSQNYGRIPIIITENGMADDGQSLDYDRVSYFNEYINQMLLAIYEDGCNVRGYFAWSLMDSFEWKFGHTIKFGLYYVDFANRKRTRIPKLSAFNFREIARTRRVNFDYV